MNYAHLMPAVLLILVAVVLGLSPQRVSIPKITSGSASGKFRLCQCGDGDFRG